MTHKCNNCVIATRILLLTAQVLVHSTDTFFLRLNLIFYLLPQQQGTLMPTHSETIKSTYQRRRRRQQHPTPPTTTPKHDPTALVDVHPAPPVPTLPKSTIQHIISLCCFPHPRKPQRRSLSPPPASPIFPISSTTQSESTYTSFPAPTFAHNGQPRALDSRLHTDSISSFSSESNCRGGNADPAYSEGSSKEIPDSNTTQQDRTPPQLQLPTLTCPYSHPQT